jgi:hypothetical protein
MASAPVALQIAGAIGLGVIAGYVSVAFGLTAIALAIMLSISALAWFRRRFAVEGLYFACLA